MPVTDPKPARRARTARGATAALPEVVAAGTLAGAALLLVGASDPVWATLAAGGLLLGGGLAARALHGAPAPARAARRDT